MAQAPQMPAIQPTRDWTVTGRLTTSYDTNVARVAKGFDSRRGLQAEDWIVTPSVSGRIVQPLGRQYVFAEGSAGYDFYGRNEVLDRARFQATAGVGTTLGPCRPIIYANYASSQSDIADLDLTTAQNRLETTSTAAGIQCGRPVGPAVAVIAQRSDSKNSANTISIQDRTQETLTTSLAYNAPTLANVSVIWTYSDTEFPNRITPGRPVGDGFWMQSIGLRAQRDFGRNLSIGLTGSRTLVKREFSITSDPLKFTSTTYQGDLVYRFGRRIQAEVNLLRDVRPSNRPGKTVDIVDGAEGRIRYRVNQRASVLLGHSYQQVRSNGDTAGFVRDVVTNAYINGTYGSLEYKTPGRLGFSLDVRHEDRNTNLPILNYISTRVGLTTTVSF